MHWNTIRAISSRPSARHRFDEIAFALSHVAGDLAHRQPSLQRRCCATTQIHDDGAAVAADGARPGRQICSAWSPVRPVTIASESSRRNRCSSMPMHVATTWIVVPAKSDGLSKWLCPRVAWSVGTPLASSRLPHWDSAAMPMAESYSFRLCSGVLDGFMEVLAVRPYVIAMIRLAYLHPFHGLSPLRGTEWHRLRQFSAGFLPALDFLILPRRILGNV